MNLILLLLCTFLSLIPASSSYFENLKQASSQYQDYQRTQLKEKEILNAQKSLLNKTQDSYNYSMHNGHQSILKHLYTSFTEKKEEKENALNVSSKKDFLRSKKEANNLLETTGQFNLWNTMANLLLKKTNILAKIVNIGLDKEQDQDTIALFEKLIDIPYKENPEEYDPEQIVTIAARINPSFWADGNDELSIKQALQSLQGKKKKWYLFRKN